MSLDKMVCGVIAAAFATGGAVGQVLDRKCAEGNGNIVQTVGCESNAEYLRQSRFVPTPLTMPSEPRPIVPRPLPDDPAIPGSGVPQRPPILQPRIVRPIDRDLKN